MEFKNNRAKHLHSHHIPEVDKALNITAQVSLGKIRGSIRHYPLDDTAQFPRIQRKFGLCTCSLLSDQISAAPRYELDLIGGTYVDWTPVTADKAQLWWL